MGEGGVPWALVGGGVLAMVGGTKHSCLKGQVTSRHFAEPNFCSQLFKRSTFNVQQLFPKLSQIKARKSRQIHSVIFRVSAGICI
jgi:hypothetical protein